MNATPKLNTDPSLELASGQGRSRMFLVDDNIRDVGGHFFELATLWADGASRLGYQPVLATNRAFNEPETLPRFVQSRPTFGPRRMVRWSLGIDGQSAVPRALDGRPIGSFPDRARQWLRDHSVFGQKRPRRMIREWTNDLLAFLKEQAPREGDVLVINTGDDFVLLAVTNALRQIDLGFRLRVHIVFHFAVTCDRQGADVQRRNMEMFGDQIDRCLAELTRYQIALHATTEPLAHQIRQTGVGALIGPIPYPTRPQRYQETAAGELPRVVLAGLPRAEKGRESIRGFLSAIENDLLETAQCCVSMQMPANRWHSMIPESLRAEYIATIQGGGSGCFDIKTENLAPNDYHQWLDGAGIGLFLYESHRYVARCSGVLLEMMSRGVPVIVPDGCWLADQVRLAGGDGSVGRIYSDLGELPHVLAQLLDDLSSYQVRSRLHARHIHAVHDGKNSLIQMGVRAALRTHAWVDPNEKAAA